MMDEKRELVGVDMAITKEERDYMTDKIVISIMPSYMNKADGFDIIYFVENLSKSQKKIIDDFAVKDPSTLDGSVDMKVYNLAKEYILSKCMYTMLS